MILIPYFLYIDLLEIIHSQEQSLKSSIIFSGFLIYENSNIYIIVINFLIKYELKISTLL